MLSEGGACGGWDLGGALGIRPDRVGSGGWRLCDVGI